MAGKKTERSREEKRRRGDQAIADENIFFRPEVPADFFSTPCERSADSQSLLIKIKT